MRNCWKWISDSRQNEDAKGSFLFLSRGLLQVSGHTLQHCWHHSFSNISTNLQGHIYIHIIHFGECTPMSPRWDVRKAACCINIPSLRFRSDNLNFRKPWRCRLSTKQLYSWTQTLRNWILDTMCIVAIYSIGHVWCKKKSNGIYQWSKFRSVQNFWPWEQSKFASDFCFARPNTQATDRACRQKCHSNHSNISLWTLRVNSEYVCICYFSVCWLQIQIRKDVDI